MQPVPSQQDVFDMVHNMRNQNISYRDIAKHLDGIGYRSHLTKRPIGEQAIRNIAGKMQGDQKKAEKAEKRSEAIYLTRRKQSVAEGVSEILAMKAFTDDLKVKFIELLLKEA